MKPDISLATYTGHFNLLTTSCGRTLLVLLAVLPAVLRSIFAAFQNPLHPHHGRKRAVFVFTALFLLTGGNARAQVPVPVTAVPIVVESTTAEYFVLYVRHDLDGTEVEIPVLVKRGEAGTTTLAENVEALPAERYRVEKYLVAAPADVDGDGIDDITELGDLGNMNPVNPAAAIELTNGAVAVPDRATLETLTSGTSGFASGKFIMYGMGTDRPGVYFINVNTTAGHGNFLDSVGLEWGGGLFIGHLSYSPGNRCPRWEPGTLLLLVQLSFRLLPPYRSRP